MNKDVRALKDDALEKLNTRKSTSRMILTEKLEKFWTSDLCSKLFCTSSSRYDKQVTTTTTTTTTNAIVGVTCDPIGNQMVYPTTSLWREHLSSFKIVFFFLTLKGRLPVKWTAYEALLYGVYTTQSDVWVVNIIWHLKLPCTFYVKYKCSHLSFLLQLELRYPPLRDTHRR